MKGVSCGAGLVVVFGLLLAGCIPGGDDELVGKWSLDDGAKIRDIIFYDNGRYHFDFTSDKFVAGSRGGLYYAMPSVTPRRIDIEMKAPFKRWYHGLYEIDGDQLTILLDRVRPTLEQFSASAYTYTKVLN